MNGSRLEAFKRKIASDRLAPQESLFHDQNHLNRVVLEAEKPLYVAPSDFIDEFGRILVVEEEEELAFELPVHLQTSGPEALSKLSAYMRRRFPERLLQCQSLASVSEQVYRAWRSRTRKREAEWGDPEDLGTIPPINNAAVTDDSLKIAPEVPQLAVSPKFLLPNFFIQNLLPNGPALYYSNRPSLLPSHPTNRFTANTAVWSPNERKTFIELYLQNPKNFGKISAHLPYKSCEQCVEFYYRHKKEYRLKQMVASYRKAMVAQRKLILNTSTTLVSSTTTTLVPTTTTTMASMNILPAVSATISSEEESIPKRKIGRPVGRPKNKDKDRERDK